MCQVLRKKSPFFYLEKSFKIALIFASIFRLGNVKSLHIVRPQDVEKEENLEIQGEKGCENTETIEIDMEAPPGLEEEIKKQPGGNLGEFKAQNGILTGGQSEGSKSGEKSTLVTKNSEEIEEFRVGRVYVEFSREESTEKAAHSLEGRLFNNRPINASYFPLRLYQLKFKKGLTAQTHQERQALALAVQSHLTKHLPD